jgi:hypothetical protein
MMRRIHIVTTGWLLALLLGCASSVFAQERPGRLEYSTDELRLSLSPRTPEQLAAFYEARGFPNAMIELIRSRCFFTVGIHNKTRGILWHDLSRWRFLVDGQPVARIDRGAWRSEWARLQAPMRSQSTFRWTLLPESLDFRPDEAEGGNVTLPRVEGEITLEAPFVKGVNRDGGEILARIDGLRCAGGAP